MLGKSSEAVSVGQPAAMEATATAATEVGKTTQGNRTKTTPTNDAASEQ